jgi:hypothetical protein
MGLHMYRSKTSISKHLELPEARSQAAPARAGGTDGPLSFHREAGLHQRSSLWPHCMQRI